jgi:hypothetical protein
MELGKDSHAENAMTINRVWKMDMRLEIVLAEKIELKEAKGGPRIGLAARYGHTEKIDLFGTCSRL